MYKLNKLMLVSLTAICISGLFSCSQEEDMEVIQTGNTCFHVYAGNEPGTTPTNGENENDSLSSLRFSYRGEFFESKVLYTDDKAVILNEQIANIFENLKKKENVAIFVNEDGSFDFYNSFEEMNSCRKWKEKMRSSTRGANDLMFIQKFKLRVWKNAKGRKKGGPCIEWEMFNNDNTVSPPPFYIGGKKGQMTPIEQSPNYPIQIKTYNDNLWKYNMDNEISSCQMWATIAKGGKVPYIGLGPGQCNHANVTFYENYDFTGRSLTFSEISVNYTYSQRDYFSSFGFDNITSSIMITFDDNLD